MSSILVSLGVGSALLIVGCFVLGRFLGNRAGAVVAFTLVATAYLALAAVRWPGVDVAAIHVALFACIALTYSLLPRLADGERRGRLAWGPVFIVAFFAVVVSVNVVFLLLAEHGLPSGIAALMLPEPAAREAVTSRFPGTVSPGANKRELLYDRHLQRLDEQAARGWQVEKGWLAKPVAGQPAVFQVVIEDDNGRPLQGATVSGSFLRASDRSADRSFAMNEAGAGVYRSEVSLPLPGNWHLLLTIDWGNERHLLRGTTTVSAAAVES